MSEKFLNGFEVFRHVEIWQLNWISQEIYSIRIPTKYAENQRYLTS